MTLAVGLAIGVSALITFFLRAFPFVFFGGKKSMPSWLDNLGKILPPAIMAVLIVYCLKDVKTDLIHSGIPKLAGVLSVFITYKLKHNTLISIVLGTAVCMVLMALI